MILPNEIPITVLIPIGVICFAVCIFGFIRYNRNRKLNAEMVTIMSFRIKNRIQEHKRQIEAQYEDGYLNVVCDNFYQQTDDVLQAHKQQVISRIKQEIDGTYFMTALKGSVGDKIGKVEWQTHFQQHTTEKIQTILKVEQLENHYQGIQQLIAAELVQNWTPQQINTILPEKYNTQRLQNLLNLNGLERDIFQGFGGLGIGAFGSLILASTQLENKYDHLITGFDFLLGNAFLEGIRVWLGEVIEDLLIEYIGEEITDELLEAIGIALTGIGAVFTAYKVVKIGLKLKKLLYDKEPLVRLQNQLQAEIFEVLDQRHLEIQAQYEQYIEMQYREVHHSLTRLEKKMLDNIIKMDARLSNKQEDIDRIDALILQG